MRIALIQLPTLSLELGIRLNNVYRRTMPPSLARVATAIHRSLPGWQADILDLRILNPYHDVVYKTIEWEGRRLNCRRVGGEFELATEAILNSEWLGLTSHFTCERTIVRDFIRFAKRVKPQMKVAVGGADATARPQVYIEFGADYVAVGDIDPVDFASTIEFPRIAPAHRGELHLLPAFDLLDHLQEYIEGHDGPVPKGVAGPVVPIIFTKGCSRGCNFCEGGGKPYRCLDLDEAVELLNHYESFGLRNFDILDDNLLLQVGNPKQRDKIIKLFRIMVEREFSWNFPNGLEVGQLIRHGRVDEELVQALFFSRRDAGRTIGCFRLFFPIETFDSRDNYQKLKALDEQNEIIRAVASRKIPHLSFGLIIFPDADKKTFQIISRQYSEVKGLVNTASQGKTLVRCGVFHLIPIGQFRGMDTKYPEDLYPELWNFYTPAYDGSAFSARELFEKRMEVSQQIDPTNFLSMLRGSYGYGQ